MSLLRCSYYMGFSGTARPVYKRSLRRRYTYPVAARHMRQLRPGLGRASPVILGKRIFFSPKTKSNSCLLICQSEYEGSVSLTKSDGCGKNNDCSALGPGLRYFESHEPPLYLPTSVHVHIYLPLPTPCLLSCPVPRGCYHGETWLHSRCILFSVSTYL